MFVFYFDASALAKRYVKEKGSDVVNKLFMGIKVDNMRVLIIGLAEVVFILVRKKNDGRLSLPLYRASQYLLKKEVLDSHRFPKIDVQSSLVTRSLPLIKKHSLNATDAILLRSAMDMSAFESARDNEIIFVTADIRLLTAAQAEGIRTINPELVSISEIELLLPSV